jgi:hypothetical protein
MNSRGNPARSHKSGIKTAGGRLEELRAERANLSGADTPPFEATADHMQALPGIASALLSEMSEGKRGRNEQPGADQQGERDTADHRENVVAATGGLGVGGGSLRRQERHPEVTHGIGLRSPLAET